MTRLFAELQERRVRNRLRVIGRFLQQGRLLEVGPGSGEVLRRLAEKGYQVSGAEHSPELADVIRQNLGIPVKTGAFEQQRFEDTPYDGFLSFHVIEHVTDPIAHLRKAAELVRPGGFAFIATPNADSWEHRLVGGLSPNYSPVHLQLFSRESLTRMLQQTGWEVATVMTPCYTDAWLRIVSSLLRRLRGKRGGSGQLAQQSDTPFRRRAIALLSLLDLPLRMTQQQLRGGNELFVVGHRTD